MTGIAVFLKRHLNLVRSAIEFHEGTVLDHTGDGLCAFWHNYKMCSGDAAVSALSTAAKLSKSIAEDNRRRCALGLPTRRVRVGLNSGEVALERSDCRGTAPRLYGATVHEARRIEQAGKRVRSFGEQVIIMASQATLQLAEFELAARSGNKFSASFGRSPGLNGAVFPREDMQTAAPDCLAVQVDPRVIMSVLRGRTVS